MNSWLMKLLVNFEWLDFILLGREISIQVYCKKKQSKKNFIRKYYFHKFLHLQSKAWSI